MTEDTRILSDDEVEKLFKQEVLETKKVDTISFVSIIGWTTVCVGVFLLIVGVL